MQRYAMLLPAMFPVAVTAQIAPELRTLRPAYAAIAKGESVVVSSAQAMAKDSATLQWGSLDYPGPDSSIALPFQTVGGALALDKNLFVVTGCATAGASPVGKLCVVQANDVTGGLSITQTVSLPGIDPYAIAWNQSVGVLGIIDAANQCLLTAPFQGGVLPAAATFTIALSSGQASPLAGNDPYIFAEASGFLLKANRLAPAGIAAWSGLAWGFTPRPMTFNPYWGIDTSVLGHSQPLQVMCGGNSTFPATFSIHQLGEYPGVVASGQQTGPQTPVTVAPPQEFYDYPGAPFQIVSGSPSNIAESVVFRPLVRYGVPMNGGGIVPGRGSISETAVPGGTINIRCNLAIPSIQDASESPFEFQPYLWIGLGVRDGTTPDPVTIHGNLAVLSAVAALDLATVKQYWQLGTVSVPFAIPSTPGLEGLILLFQWVFQPVATPTQLSLSDVFATRIYSQGAGTSSMTATGNGSTSSPSLGSRQASTGQAARTAWQESLNSGPSESSRTRQAQIHDRLLNNN